MVIPILKQITLVIHLYSKPSRAVMIELLPYFLEKEAY